MVNDPLDLDALERHHRRVVLADIAAEACQGCLDDEPSADWPCDPARLLAEVRRLRRLFCDLTPGGSEFVNNPDNCAAWVRERMCNTSALLVETKIKQRDAEAALAAVQAREKRR